MGTSICFVTCWRSCGQQRYHITFRDEEWWEIFHSCLGFITPSPQPEAGIQMKVNEIVQLLSRAMQWWVKVWECTKMESTRFFLVFKSPVKSDYWVPNMVTETITGYSLFPNPK